MAAYRFPVLLLLAALFSVPSKAILISEVEPIIGYERVQKLVPYHHTKDRLIYGLRFTLGFLILAGELEATRATDTEDFPDLSFSSKDTRDKVKLGLKSTIKLGGFLHAFARAGGQASRNVHEETSLGVHTRTEEAIKYKPYAGAGASAKLGKKVSFNAGITVIFNEFPKMDQAEYEAMAGFTVKFP